MSQLRLAQAACAAPLIAALRDAGAPVDRLLTQSGLHRFRIDDPSAWIPAEGLHSLFELVARRETGPSLPWEISSRYVLANMGALGAEKRQCPDLRTLFLSANDTSLLSYSTKTFSLHGVSSRISIDLAMQEEGISRKWLEVMAISLVIDGVRAAAGADWTPPRLRVSDNSPDELQGFISNQTNISNSARDFSIEVQTVHLSRPLTSSSPSLDHADPVPRLGYSLADRVKAVLDASTDDISPTVGMVSEISGVSVRTFQRRLREEGLTFFDVVDHWRCNRALELMTDPRLTVTDISQIARYSHASHFIRAFKRWTGVTPQSFRDGLPASL